MIHISEHVRYAPLIPCPWRHDIKLKPNFNTPKVIDLQTEFNCLKNMWNVNFHTVNRHILFDLDSWYLHAAGLFDFDLTKDRIKTEQAVQKLLNGTSLTAEERDDIIEEYGAELDIKHVEQLKLEKTGETYWDELRNSPFCTRYNVRIPITTSLPVDCTQFPNRYARICAERRIYTKLELRILNILTKLN